MIRVITVVRDFGMYNRLIMHNPCLRGCNFISFDNNDSNEFITKRYNSYVDNGNFSEDDWLVFCHEDFEFLEPLEKKIDGLKLDPMAVYGIAGLDFEDRSQGCTLNSQKDGSGITVAGYPFRAPKLVATVDCMCLIVSAALIKKTGLRFDENLSFDLYAEDFCIQAKEKYGISSYVLPIRSQHYSWGVVGDRFMKQYKYLCDKYRNSKHVYYTTLARRIGRGCYDEKPMSLWPLRPYRFGLFLKRMTDDGYLTWSIWRYRLCFYRKRLVDPLEWKKANPGLQ